MRIQLITVLVGLCGAALAAPTHESRDDKRIWPIPFPGEDGEGSEGPTLPFPSLPIPTSIEDAIENGLPFIGRPPLEGLGDLGEGFPWQSSESGEQDDESQDRMAKEAAEN